MKKKALLFAGIGVAVIFIGIAGYSTQAGTVEAVAEIEEPETAEKEPETSPSPTPVPSPTPMPTEEPAKEEEFIQSLREEEKEVIEVTAMDAQMYAVQNVNLRSENAVTSEALRTISFGEQVHVIGITADKQWYQVEDKEKGTGYVASSYLSDTKPVQNQSEVQRQSGNDGLAVDQQSGGNGGGEVKESSINKLQNTDGMSQADIDALNAILGQQKPYEQNFEAAGEGMKGAGTHGSINQ